MPAACRPSPGNCSSIRRSDEVRPLLAGKRCLRRRAVGRRSWCARLKEKFPRVVPGNGWGMTETRPLHRHIGPRTTSTARRAAAPQCPSARCRSWIRRRRNGAARRRGRRALVQGPAGGAGLLEQAARPPRRPSSTAGCAPATSPASTRRASAIIIDRAKDMLIRGGENIYCIEVENVLYDHPGGDGRGPGRHPAPTLGEEPAAVVVPEARRPRHRGGACAPSSPSGWRPSRCR